MQVPEIRKGDLFLRQIQTSDAEDLCKIANNKNIWINMRDQFPHPYTKASADAFIAMLLDEKNPNYVWSIHYKNNIAGMVGIHPQQDVYKQNAEIGYWLGEPFWGLGIMSRCTKVMVSFGFNELKLMRLFAGVFSYNEGSKKVLLKNGFELEGVGKNAILKDHKYADEWRYSIINENLAV